jgi:hypothetical protein
MLWRYLNTHASSSYRCFKNTPEHSIVDPVFFWKSFTTTSTAYNQMHNYKNRFMCACRYGKQVVIKRITLFSSFTYLIGLSYRESDRTADGCSGLVRNSHHCIEQCMCLAFCTIRSAQYLCAQSAQIVWGSTEGQRGINAKYNGLDRIMVYQVSGTNAWWGRYPGGKATYYIDTGIGYWRLDVPALVGFDIADSLSMVRLTRVQAGASRCKCVLWLLGIDPYMLYK